MAQRRHKAQPPEAPTEADRVDRRADHKLRQRRRDFQRTFSGRSRIIRYSPA
jgi:hypothetical protein